MHATERLGMRPPRMTTRRWMLVVASVAFLAAAWVDYGRLSQRSIQYQKRAHRFQNLYIHHSRDVSNYCDWCVDEFRAMKSRDSASMPEGRIQNIKREFDVIQSSNAAVADYYLTLAGKYERVAAEPWRNVSPDPAPPACLRTLDTWLKKSLYAQYGWSFPPPIPPDSRPWWTVHPFDERRDGSR